MVFSDYFGELAAIAGAICFGLGNVIIKSQGSKIKPMAVNAIRLSFTAVFYLILLLSLGALRTAFSLDYRTGLLLVGGSILGIIFGDVVFYFSQQLIGLSRSYPIAASYPLLTYLIGIILRYEIYDLLRIQGVMLVVLGVYLVSSSTESDIDKYIRISNIKPINYQFIEEQEQKKDNNSEAIDQVKRKKRNLILGILGAATTALCWAIGTIMLDRALTIEIPGINANAYRTICIAPLALAIFFVGNRGKQKSEFSRKGVLLVLLAGIIGNTLGSLFYLFALSYTDASTTAAITAASPLIAAPLSILLLKEKMSLVLVLGTLLTISGIWLIILY
ncbi:MAG: DMT family transporter [Candidatus Heimdallarchaeota archaeon]|nr:DMT family transporter [Candidatus Heimdallarchaeota archaeon]MBY8995272.1 DMT family transporter [Candidatus Heimdallarchaeota archaeon]